LAFGAKFILTFGVSTVGVTLIPVIYAISGNLQFVYLMLAGFAATAGIAAFNLPSEPVRRPVAAE
jgi:FSR family fosmidomycin resistance protein-like MFS transporter